MSWLAALSAAGAACAACAGCAGKLPPTRYYQLADAERRPQHRAVPEDKPQRGDGIVVLESLATDPAYDDERIVYRTTPFRLDYYQYHRWTSSPGVMVGNYLERALEASGKFRAVVREMTPDAAAVLAGRVLAIEEVDRSKAEWLARIVLELVLTDAHTGALLWTEQLEETQPLRQQDPEGLAAALSVAMSRIAVHIVPTIIGAIRTAPESPPPRSRISNDKSTIQKLDDGR